jgi:hypothetical protein
VKVAGGPHREGGSFLMIYRHFSCPDRQIGGSQYKKWRDLYTAQRVSCYFSILGPLCSDDMLQ